MLSKKFSLYIFLFLITKFIYSTSEDKIYLPTIHSVQFTHPDFAFSLPVVDLQNKTSLILSFDDVTEEFKQFYYTIEYYDVNWQKLNLQPQEYIYGYFEGTINNFLFSKNVKTNYIHYWLEFPNEEMQPIISGNYLIKVYTKRGNENFVAFQKRFYVLDSKVLINAKVKPDSNVETKWRRQEVDFQIEAIDVDIVNPYQNLKVFVSQNNRTDNIKSLQPKFVNGKILDFDYDAENVFDGGNEFRYFDIKSLSYRTPEISDILNVDNALNVVLTTDVKRTFQKYTSESDINGRYFIKTDDYQDSRCQSEYVYVIFTLQMDAPRTDGTIHILGELTNWQLNEESRMNYNYEIKAYQKRLYLKQGLYNYIYAFLPKNSKIADIGELEGNHYETENEYAIWVYYRQPGSRFDELIGLKFVNSRN